ncbi:hypothetical protein KFL_000360300 [Klebsormidium nitens]|uniref:Pyrrolo-quinoline quinone repeat domain-containing protein n=1 Tax=Klebsormidium nitens TaxID=105231 RepID=A0A1Y1HM88_KLENI|nr:hypothetical protein KFL_000360300 [Klebsormidium nitens]|eukprot:GAQ79714.1 hypothetical protein KFL_000360300 [Klebsormidium nitens]
MAGLCRPLQIILLVALLGGARAQSLLWQTRTPLLDSFTAAPVAGPDGQVYVCSGRSLLAFDTDGRLEWNAALPGGSQCQTLVAPFPDSRGNVYVAAGASLLQVSATGRSTPTVTTVFTVPNAGQRGVGVLGVTPSADGSVLYINGATQGLFAIRLDGTPVWKNATGSALPFTVAADGRADVTCGSADNPCYFYSSPSVDVCTGDLYIANSDGYLYSLSLAAAALRWRVRLPLASATQVGVTVSGGTVYAAAATPGRIMAFSTNGGAAWTQTGGYAFGSLDYRSPAPIVGPGGTVLVGSSDGSVYVVDASGSSVSAYSSVPGGTNQAGTITSPPVLDCSGSAVWVAWAAINGAAVTVAAIDGSGAVKVALQYNASAAARPTAFAPSGSRLYSVDAGTLQAFDVLAGGAAQGGSAAARAACALNARQRLSAGCPQNLAAGGAGSRAGDMTVKSAGGGPPKLLPLYIVAPVAVFLVVVLAVAYFLWERQQRRLVEAQKEERRKNKRLHQQGEFAMKKVACEEALSQLKYDLQTSDPSARDDLIRRKISLEDSLRTLVDLMQDEARERASSSLGGYPRAGSQILPMIAEGTGEETLTALPNESLQGPRLDFR